MRPMTAAVVAAIAMACAPAAEAPTPTVGSLEAVRDSETEVLLARVTVGGAVVGFALSCDDARPLMAVYLGPFPSRLQALQLATRTAGGAVTRFGGAFRADAASGLHSPQLAGDDLDGFLQAVLEPGTLVSNGYRSYRESVGSFCEMAAMARSASAVRTGPLSQAWSFFRYGLDRVSSMPCSWQKPINTSLRNSLPLSVSIPRNGTEGRRGADPPRRPRRLLPARAAVRIPSSRWRYRSAPASRRSCQPSTIHTTKPGAGSCQSPNVRTGTLPRTRSPPERRRRP